MKLLLLAGAALLAGCSTPIGAHTGLIDVTIYDRATERELPVYRSGGKLYVAGKPGNDYEVIIKNTSPRDLLAVVSVDGVNVVSGATAAPDQTGYVISARNRVVIKGWRKSLDAVAKFYFTNHGDAYATRTGRPENVGVIGVAVFPRKVYRLHEEQLGAASKLRSRDAAAEAAAPSPSLGTGHGPREQSHAQYVEFERESNTPAQLVTVYYDSYPNLVARGVIPSKRLDPRPFPGPFAPDPAG